MKLLILDEDEGLRAFTEPYEVRIPGWTWQRYLREGPEMRLSEYVEGTLIMHSPVSRRHQQLVRFLAHLLTSFCCAADEGEVLIGPAVLRVAPDRGREPDIFVLAPEDAGGADEQVVEAIPSLIVEVTGTGSHVRDLVDKASEYRDLGVGEYWVVEYEECVVYHHLLERSPAGTERYSRSEHRQGRLESTALPGFFIEVEWLWKRPLPRESPCWELIRPPA